MSCDLSLLTEQNYGSINISNKKKIKDKPGWNLAEKVVKLSSQISRYNIFLIIKLKGSNAQCLLSTGYIEN